ncbi:hypothetical protein ACIBQ1_52575 [Nonomuraea sp. NPDC050153]|uniref:hypothetical protein n=1 Tax=Nonomuraea sp. NPDC050153 TaxID=3364359 RepID=UPI00378F0E35
MPQIAKRLIAAIAATCVTLTTMTIMGASVTSASAEVAAAPSCVKLEAVRTEGSYKYATVRNDCSYTVTVKIAVTNGPDSPCKSISPAKKFVFRLASSAKLSGIVSC